jgi:hypothetical protein
MMQVVLTPPESRRLIARAVAHLPEVKKALKDGIICIGRGITNGMIVEEINGSFERKKYVVGCIRPRRLCQGLYEETFQEIVFLHGEMKFLPSKEIIKEMGPNDIFIKGANAIDVYGNAGILVAGDGGGTIGGVMGDIYTKGIQLLVPVGLEKLILGDITELAPYIGKKKVSYSMGMPVGLFPVSGRIITEIEALESFADVMVRHIASGGVGGAEGAVVLSVDGEEKEVEKALTKIRSVLNEKSPPIYEHECATCTWKACPWVGKETHY